MPLDKLIERILSDARERAERITSEAQMRRMEMISEANREEEALSRRIVEAAKRAADEEKKQRTTMAALEARKAILEEKQALISEVFERALKALVGLPQEQYVELMVGMLVAVMDDKDGQLILSAVDRQRVGEEIVARANSTLEGSARRGRVSLSSRTRDIAGGFILFTEGVEINDSFEAQIESRRLELEPLVVEILFSERAQE
ncbi:MAG: V-type ATP synthase subunit E [Actinobacteria bacterium]|nr:V-type ATP synthase subunit E [Actinomycetota bacterium]